MTTPKPLPTCSSDKLSGSANVSKAKLSIIL